MFFQQTLLTVDVHHVQGGKLEGAINWGRRKVKVGKRWVVGKGVVSSKGKGGG